jgi:hypothetical protein
LKEFHTYSAHPSLFSSAHPHLIIGFVKMPFCFEIISKNLKIHDRTPDRSEIP